jgi:hypothetical protein
MRKIIYAGGAFYTGDALAKALLQYAAALALNHSAAVVDLPVRTLHGGRGTQSLVLGPASQVMSETTEFDDLDEITDDDALVRLETLTAELTGPLLFPTES